MRSAASASAGTAAEEPRAASDEQEKESTELSALPERLRVAYRTRWCHVARYRASSVVLGVPLVALFLWSHATADDSSSGGTNSWLPVFAAALTFGGWTAGLAHGYAETQQPPTTGDEVASRLRRATRRHALSLSCFVGGLLLLVVWAADSPPLVVTSVALLAGLVLRPAARGRKAATALARDLDRVLRLDVQAQTAGPDSCSPETLSAWREAVEDLVISGSTGIDTGFAVGWWGVRGLHPETIACLLAAAAARPPLDADLARSLKDTRQALDSQIGRAHV